MTTSLRSRAATFVLAVSAAASTVAAAAVPASATPASDPCAAAYRLYQSDHDKAAEYYAIYRRSSGAARTKAYDSYVQYRNRSQRDLQDYDTCLHNH